MNFSIFHGSGKQLLRLALYVPVIIVSLFWLLLTGPASSAADECIEKPNAPAPQGSHWYYRIDRASKRQCWYLGAEGAKVRTPANQTATRVRTPAPKPVVQPPSEESVDDGMVAVADGGVVEKTSPAVASLNWQGLPTSTFSTGDGALPDIVARHATPEPTDDAVKPAAAASQLVAEQPPQPAIRLGYLLAVLAGALGVAGFVGYAVLRLAASQPKLGESGTPAAKSAKAQDAAHVRRAAERTQKTETLEERMSPRTQPADRVTEIQATLARLLQELEQRHGELTGAHIKAHRAPLS